MVTRVFPIMLLLAAAAAASAQPADPDPNGIGIYFDPGAVDKSWCATAEVDSQVIAYLCLTRASDSSGFTDWEARIESSVPTILAGYQLQGDATNAATAPEFVVSYGTPFPYQLSTVLLEITIDVVWEWSIALRVWPAAAPRGAKNLPAYATVDTPAFQTLGYSFGWDESTEIPNWCASINDAGCLGGPSVDVEETAWGRVKALYR